MSETTTHDPATCRNGDHYGQCSGATLPALATEVRETREPATTHTIDGTILSMQSTPRPELPDGCICCRPRAHVFCYGVDLPFEVSGVNGPTAASPADWIHRILFRYRFDRGRKVRLTLEILDELASPITHHPTPEGEQQ